MHVGWVVAVVAAAVTLAVPGIPDILKQIRQTLLKNYNFFLIQAYNGSKMLIKMIIRTFFIIVLFNRYCPFRVLDFYLKLDFI